MKLLDKIKSIFTKPKPEVPKVSKFNKQDKPHPHHNNHGSSTT